MHGHMSIKKETVVVCTDGVVSAVTEVLYSGYDQQSSVVRISEHRPCSPIISVLKFIQKCGLWVNNFRSSKKLLNSPCTLLY